MTMVPFCCDLSAYTGTRLSGSVVSYSGDGPMSTVEKYMSTYGLSALYDTGSNSWTWPNITDIHKVGESYQPGSGGGCGDVGALQGTMYDYTENGGPTQMMCDETQDYYYLTGFGMESLYTQSLDPNGGAIPCDYGLKTVRSVTYSSTCTSILITVTSCSTAYPNEDCTGSPAPMYSWSEATISFMIA